MQLTDEDVEIAPVPTDGGGHKADSELGRLSNIIRSLNDLFGNITWLDVDRIRQLIVTNIPNKVAANAAYQNPKQNSDKQNARIEHDKALGSVIIGLMKDDTELFKQFRVCSHSVICGILCFLRFAGVSGVLGWG